MSNRLTSTTLDAQRIRNIRHHVFRLGTAIVHLLALANPPSTQDYLLKIDHFIGNTCHVFQIFGRQLEDGHILVDFVDVPFSDALPDSLSPATLPEERLSSCKHRFRPPNPDPKWAVLLAELGRESEDGQEAMTFSLPHEFSVSTNILTEGANQQIQLCRNKLATMDLPQLQVIIEEMYQFAVLLSRSRNSFEELSSQHARIVRMLKKRLSSHRLACDASMELKLSPAPKPRTRYSLEMVDAEQTVLQQLFNDVVLYIKGWLRLAFIRFLINSVSHFGCYTTSRVKGSHYQLKRHLPLRGTDFLVAVIKMKQVLNHQLGEIRSSIAKDSNTVDCDLINDPLFANINKKISFLLFNRLRC
ncbi:hypothetical protein GEMRC1_014190 [Eukaryota sp. GEM-RC1]